MAKRKKYDFELLQKYCSENNVVLLEDYKDYKLTQKTRIIGICSSKDCGEKFDKSFKGLFERNVYCKDCSNINKMNKIKQYNLLNYGYEFPFNSNNILNKSKNTCIERYGVSNPLKNNNILGKTKATLLEKYGVTIPIHNKNIKDKTKQTFLKKYGVENFLKTEEIKNIRISKCNEIYNVDYYLQSDIIQNKMKLNNIKKYGVEYTTQNENIMEKTSKNAYKLKEYIFPSGLSIKTQGYENFALDELIITEKIDESDIITGCKNVPVIWYNDETGKKHRHYVDIFIPSQNKCIEVKSTWTAEKKKDCIFLKQNAAKELGYKYEIWVYNSKKEKINCYN